MAEYIDFPISTIKIDHLDNKQIIVKVKDELKSLWDYLKYHINSYPNNIILETKNFLENLDDILSQLLIIKDEYSDFLILKLIFNYFLDNKKLINKSNLDFLKNLFNRFFDLIDYKLKCLEDNNQLAYEKEYEEFSIFLFNQEQIFFTEICKPSENYDEEALSKINNSLLSY